MEDPNFKFCRICNKIKSVDEFYRKQSDYTLAKECISCFNPFVRNPRNYVKVDPPPKQEETQTKEEINLAIKKKRLWAFLDK